MKRILGILLIVIPVFVSAQDTIIGGVVNYYYAVDTIDNASNRLVCDQSEDLSSLIPGDKVVLMQVTGGLIDTLDSGWDTLGASGGTIEEYYAAGRYEFLSVSNINQSTKEVFFTANLKRTYVDTERVQLIRVLEGEEVIVNSELTASPWDSSKGGVVAIVALKKLVLNADINVSGMGFHGANPEPWSVPQCRDSIVNDTFYFKTSAINKGGNKGEGVSSIYFPYTKGMGHLLNGGGGGAGRFGGGGGGSNFSNGGIGGSQDADNCTFSDGQRAHGGKALGNKFYKPQPEGYLSVTFGGGGGSSTENGASSNFATSGGNGGGIVIILTDSLVSNNLSIYSDGDSVNILASAGGGGGGAGGTVVIDAEYISPNLNIYVRGGKGGNTNGECGGAGGGGAGGLFWHNGTGLPSSYIISRGEGEGGTTACGIDASDGGSGVVGDILNNYIPLLNGFSFNSITGVDTICEGLSPDLIMGSNPKGVTSPVYEWLWSYNDTNWTAIVSSNTKNYQPEILDTTTFFTRVVTDDDLNKDTALSVKIYVYPKLENNLITLRDTLCYNTSPGQLEANSITGGDSPNYTYNWESSLNQSSWLSRGSDEKLTEGTLEFTTYYRRIVHSAGVCSDTSNIDTLTILSLIGDNIIDNTNSDTTICYGLSAGVIKAKTPTGGDGSYKYRWLYSTDNISYSSIGATNINYTPGALNDSMTHYYKRIVFSGIDSVCIDTTSTPRSITVHPTIINNNITTDSMRYCAGEQNALSLKQEPADILKGGNDVFRYQWSIKSGTSWVDVSGATESSYSPGLLEDTSVFRRRVASGHPAYDACIDTSSTLKLDIIPYIGNTLSSSDEKICEGTILVPFVETTATGGAGSYSYLWLQDENFSGWSPASGTNNGISYSPQILNNSTLFARVVNSEICSDTSNNITVTVYPLIDDNIITGNVNKFVCFNTDITLDGSVPQGGKPASEFSYFWQSSDDNLNWNDTLGTNEDFIATAMTASKYFRRVVYSGESAQCKDTSEYSFVQINLLPTGDIVSSVDTICSGEEISISYSVSGAGPWVIELGETIALNEETLYTDSEGEISFPLLDSANIKVLTIIDDSACHADLSGNTGLVQAKVYDVPLAKAGDDFEVCGLTTELNAEPSIGKGFWQLPGASFSDSSLPNARITLSEDNYGDFTLTWTEYNTTKCVDTDEVIVTFYKQPDTVYAGEDIVLPYEFITTLSALEPEVGEGSWKISPQNGSFGDSTLNNSTIELYDVGEYTLKWTVVNGTCDAISDSLNLKVSDLLIYEGFSPNGDGINDDYTINFTEGSFATLTIIDKNGNMVTELSGENSISWNGKNEKGAELPSGIYFYIFKEKGNGTGKNVIDSRRGYIEIRK